MRYNEIRIVSERMLDELRMGPSNLKQFVASPAAQGMQAGFEAELIFSGLGDAGEAEPEWEPDYDQDDRVHSIEHIIDFLQSGDFSNIHPRRANAIRDDMQNDYMEWLDEKMSDDWERDKDVFIREYLEVREDLEGEELKQRTEAALEKQNDDYDNAAEAYREDWQETHEYDESDWLRSIGIRYMTDASNAYDDLEWPHYTDVNQDGGDGEFSPENARRLAQNLESELGVETTVSGGYHGATRDTSTWIFEPDGSLEGNESDDMPVEIVSPPMPLAQALEIMPKFFAWAESNGAYANKSTGFHMSVSMPEHASDNLDYTKLALFLGDEYVLQQFGRTANTYARSAISKIREKKGNVNVENVLNIMRKHLNQMASNALAQPSGFGKYTSINPKNNYIEFRSAGGANYFQDINKIQNTLMRYAQATSIAMDPDAEKSSYAKKMYKLLTDVKTQQVTDPKTGTKRTQAATPVDNDAISIFSRYVAGDLPKAALKSFIKAMQYNREVERQKSGGQMSPDYDPNGNYVLRKRGPDKEPVGPIVHRFTAANAIDAINTSEKWLADRGLGKSSMHLANIDNVPADILSARPSPAPRLWKVTHPNRISLIQVQATSAAEAVQMAQREWGDRMNPNDSYRAELVAPATQTPQTDQLNSPAEDDPAGNYVLRRREGSAGTGPVMHRFSAPNNMAAVTAAREWTTSQGIERGTVWLDHISGVPPEVLNARPTNLPSQTDAENRLGLGDQTADANYEIIDNRNQTSVFKLIANTTEEAQRKLADWKSAAGLPADTQDYGIRRLPPRSNSIPEVPLDVAQNFPQAGSQFSGEWKVVDGLGREVHRFSGIGNAQSDANRVAREWAQRTGFDGNLEVYPVMR